MLVIAGIIRIDPAKRDDAIAAATEVMAETLKEEGCNAYNFAADFSDPGLFHLFEEWESAEALKAHFGMPHMAKFTGAMAGFGVKEMNVSRYEITSKGPLRP